MRAYDATPCPVGSFDFDLPEFMHYLYLPVMMTGDHPVCRLPRNVQCCAPLLNRVLDIVKDRFDYVYLSARRGWATPGNALNRPGWHTDGFGTDDINFIWWNGAGTRFSVQEFSNISEDHLVSQRQFYEQVRYSGVTFYPEKTLYMIDRYVVHAAPEILAAGPRSFIKLSCSNERYNLVGNSHNYLFEYDWRMAAREAVRNDPHKAGADRG